MQKTKILNEGNEMERNLQILHTQRKIWKSHNRNAICQAFYYVNDNKEGDPRTFDQVIICLFCYNSLVHVFNPNKRKIKRTYNIL